jgi:hypothetical protein
MCLGGGVIAGKRSRIFEVPINVQRADLIIAAMTRVDPVISKALHTVYFETMVQAERAETLAMSSEKLTKLVQQARSAVMVGVRFLESRDLVKRNNYLGRKKPMESE